MLGEKCPCFAEKFPAFCENFPAFQHFHAVFWGADGVHEKELPTKRLI